MYVMPAQDLLSCWSLHPRRFSGNDTTQAPGACSSTGIWSRCCDGQCNNAAIVDGGGEVGAGEIEGGDEVEDGAGVVEEGESSESADKKVATEMDVTELGVDGVAASVTAHPIAGSGAFALTLFVIVMIKLLVGSSR